MSGLEIVGLVGTVISIVDATSKAYVAIKDLKELPEAFAEVDKRLPIVRDTLETVKSQSAKTNPDPGSWSKIVELLKGCQARVKQLQDIFMKIKDSGHGSPRSFYRKLVLKLGKGHEVESIMGAILKDLQLLATDRVFQTATRSQVRKLEQAIKELAEVNPSMEDLSPSTERSMYFNEGSGSLNVHNGTGDMNNIQGPQITGQGFTFHAPLNFGAT